MGERPFVGTKHGRKTWEEDLGYRTEHCCSERKHLEGNPGIKRTMSMVGAHAGEDGAGEGEGEEGAAGETEPGRSLCPPIGVSFPPLPPLRGKAK